METMNAVVIRSYGGREVLRMEEMPVPGIGEDEVLIRVHAAGVNPVDWKVRAGHLEGMLSYSFPLILGWDVSGTVEKTGAKAAGLAPGDAVYALTDITRNGTYAQFVAVKAVHLAAKPESADHVHAAAVPLAALTAWQALFDTAGLDKGQTVLVHAAAGGVGSFAVQFARWKGAHVLGTASANNLDFVLGLGADEVIDYAATPFEEAARDVDVVLDTMGGEVRERSFRTLKRGGVLVSTLGPPDEKAAAAHKVRGAGMMVHPDRKQLGTIARLIDNGHVRSLVTEVFPLAEADRAHEMSETGHVRGKIVLDVGG